MCRKLEQGKSNREVWGYIQYLAVSRRAHVERLKSEACPLPRYWSEWTAIVTCDDNWWARPKGGYKIWIGSITILTTGSFQVMSRESYLAALSPHSDALAGGSLDQVSVLQRTTVKWIWGFVTFDWTSAWSRANSEVREGLAYARSHYWHVINKVYLVHIQIHSHKYLLICLLRK